MSTLLSTTIYSLFIAFFANIVLCPVIIPYLTKFKFGQNIRSDGPKSHFKKSGVPTMGGIMILLSFIISSVLFFNNNFEALIIIFVTVGYGCIGFLDDYIKITKKRSLGLTSGQKITLQLIVTSVFVYYLMTNIHVSDYSEIYIPFVKDYTWDLDTLFVPFVFFVMIGTSNSVNLTDGLDGLASGVTVLVATFYIFISLKIGSLISPIGGAAVGSLLAFLLFNSYPAKVFMGDTGSLALGGLIASIAIILKMPLFLLIVGIIYILETMSVILQVGYFKLTKGKRLFKMAPLHHHFELCGLSETKIVMIFYVVTALLCLVGYLGSDVV